MTSTSSISIRPASPAEEGVLRDLSELDATPPLRRPALLALVDGQPVAALSLEDGRVAADPFTRTQDVVVLLREYLRRLPRTEADEPRRLPRTQRAYRRLLPAA